MNKNGGPDRRFKNNRQLPVLMYGRLELSSPFGLHWILDTSQPPAAGCVVAAITGAPASLQNRAKEASEPVVTGSWPARRLL